MALQSDKKMVSKGERLGWMPVDKAKHVKLSSLELKGRRVNNDRSQKVEGSFLIP
ncbi:hypothetical protein [Mucilaginibacter sp. FT3.2]|uniref:hypothetical protein n=1 Tax=Mucilaginibacter sp. FT3.2 TaxID=2723090 RepID=UPI0016175F9D|nr:hypothetical protein [Mucilaginibacter sp. FT3.2]MBB6229952.1 hypothetical protein [Mucilaginibacter sp. FT3.2]